MDINRLRYFRCIVKSGSLRSAAKILGISPGALSKAMKNLESETGISLFTNEAQKSALSDEGLQLFERSHRLIAEWDSLNEFVHSHSSEDSKTLRIASYGGFLSHALPRVVESNDKRLSFLFRLPSEIESAIVEGRAEVGLTHMPLVHEKIRHQKVGVIEMVLLQKPGEWKEVSLDRIPMVVPHPPAHGESFAHVNFDGWPVDRCSRNVKMTTESVELGLQFCAQGGVAMFAPSYLLKTHNEQSSSSGQLCVRALPDDFPKVQHDVFLVTKKGQETVGKKLEESLKAFFKV